LSEVNSDPRRRRIDLRVMGQDALQVVPAELQAIAGQWEVLTSELVGAPPPPGQPFQATAAAVNAGQRGDRCHRSILCSADTGNGQWGDPGRRRIHRPRGHIGGRD
jgi:hypothetical protein